MTINQPEFSNQTDPKVDSIHPIAEPRDRIEFKVVPISQLGPAQEPEWIWPGYIARGAITLLTGFWKAGKTTLLGYLLRDFGRGTGLVDTVLTTPTLIVSEEPGGLWAQRRDELGLPDSICFLRRDTFARPNMYGWHCFIRAVADETRECGASLVIFDTLPSAWPVLNENDAGETLEALTPLRDISQSGAGVLLVHHPRKSDGTEGTATRGSGALPGFVDILVELRRHSPEDSSDTRRTLKAMGRFESIPPEQVIELGPDGYLLLGEAQQVRRKDIMDAIQDYLPVFGPGLTAEEIRGQWDNPAKPGKTRLMQCLNQGAHEKRWERLGTGVRNDAFRYRAYQADRDSIQSPASLSDRIEFGGTNSGGAA